MLTLLQFWKYVKCRFSAVKQDHMVITAPENVIIVRIVTPVISKQGSVMTLGVRCLVFVHPNVKIVDLDLTDSVVA